MAGEKETNDAFCMVSHDRDRIFNIETEDGSMRHNQNNGRRFSGRGNGRNNGGNGGGNGGQGNGGGNHNHGNHGGNHNNGGNHNRRVNPRIQTFDSNGPEVRIRGTAYQINEKYLTLSKDAASSGDRVLAESYLQHAEHYQRLINDLSEEYNKHNPQPQQQHQSHQQHQSYDAQGDEHAHEEAALNAVSQPGAEQPILEDLDQSFLRGPSRGVPTPPQQQEIVSDEQPSVEVLPVEEQAEAAAPKARAPRRTRQTEQV